MIIKFREALIKQTFTRWSEKEYMALKTVATSQHTSVSEVIRVFTLAALEEYQDSGTETNQ